MLLRQERSLQEFIKVVPHDRELDRQYGTTKEGWQAEPSIARWL